jgi:hypothetical protein
LSAFDPESWRASRTEGDGYNFRSKMVARLVLGGCLDGRPRREVHAMLRPPDCRMPDPETESWELGFASGFQIDVDCLHVRYAADGRVQRVRVIQH